MSVLFCPAAKGDDVYSPASDDFEAAPVWKPGVTKPDIDDNEILDEISEGTPKASPIADSPGRL